MRYKQKDLDNVRKLLKQKKGASYIINKCGIEESLFLKIKAFIKKNS